jgi:hypothetical protein
LRTFEEFFKEVQSSIEQHAKRKGYRRTALADAPNELADFMASITLSDKLNAAQAHAAFECIYKCVEFLHNPRRVHMEKVAGWASLAWSRTNDETLAGKIEHN